MTNIHMDTAIVDVIVERERQNAKWGEQNHDPLTWVAVDGEEFGEACKAILEFRFGKTQNRERNLREARKELIETAAVALAAAESIDRNFAALLEIKDGTNGDDWDVWGESFRAIEQGRADDVSTDDLERMAHHYGEIRWKAASRQTIVRAALAPRITIHA